MKTICIDAGHSKDKEGAVWQGIRESEFSLELAKKLKSVLEKKGYKVILTRETERGLVKNYMRDLKKRCYIANDGEADIFISLHWNSWKNPNPTGLETFSFDGSVEGKILASIVQLELLKEFGQVDRGIKEARFAVLKYTRMPAILIETGFISNPSDRKLLTSTEYGERASQAIARALDAYFDKINQ